MNSFLAIDFETANSSRYSAYSVGLVKVVDEEIVFCGEYLIKPPSQKFSFTHLHGISWSDVEFAPSFIQVWTQIRHLFNGIDFVVAHNSSFDKSVLLACCQYYNLTPPDVEFKCTVQISRKKWNIKPTKLNNVCDYFGIPLNHHDAISDTIACAKIMLLALDNNISYGMINKINIPNVVSNRNQVLVKAQKMKGRNSYRKNNFQRQNSGYIKSNAFPKTSGQSNESSIKLVVQIIGLLIFLYIFAKACGPFKSPWSTKSTKPKSEIQQLDINRDRSAGIEIILINF